MTQAHKPKGTPAGGQFDRTLGGGAAGSLDNVGNIQDRLGTWKLSDSGLVETPLAPVKSKDALEKAIIHHLDYLAQLGNTQNPESLNELRDANLDNIWDALRSEEEDEDWFNSLDTETQRQVGEYQTYRPFHNLEDYMLHNPAVVAGLGGNQGWESSLMFKDELANDSDLR